MPEVSDALLQSPEVIPEGAQGPGSGLLGMLEHAGQGIADTWQEAGAGIAQAVTEARVSVGTAGHAVGAAVLDGAASVSGGLNVSAHIRRHPLLMMGGALLLGFAAGELTNRLRRRALSHTPDSMTGGADLRAGRYRRAEEGTTRVSKS